MDLGRSWHRVAPPRSPGDAAFLARYEKWMRPIVVAAALLPLAITTSHYPVLGVVVGVASWLVFLVDFVVQSRRRLHYSHSRLGLFDLVIVVATSPWYLLPGADGGLVVVLLRLARVVRLLFLAQGARRLLERLGRAAIVAAAVLLVCALVAYRAEEPVNPEFASVGDALWWGYVTLTTVGYGDIVPITTTGRLAGVVIMTLGIALLGVLAGSLASFFKLSPAQVAQDEADAGRDRQALGLDTAPGPPTDPAAAPSRPADPGSPEEVPPEGRATGGSGDVAALTREVVDLREQIRVLTDHVARLAGPNRPPGNGTDQPTDGGGRGGPPGS